MFEVQKSNAIPTGTYTLPNGCTVTVYNSRDCYLIWANGQIIARRDQTETGICTVKTEVIVHV